MTISATSDRTKTLGATTSSKPEADARANLAAVGGLLSALAATSCCILPVALFSLGISGAWIANFTQLAPYQPYFVAVALAFLGAGYWFVFRRPKLGCAEGAACARPLPNRIVKLVLLAATVLVIASVGFDYIAPLILT